MLGWFVAMKIWVVSMTTINNNGLHAYRHREVNDETFIIIPQDLNFNLTVIL